MRIASYNVENLPALARDERRDVGGRAKVLGLHAELNAILGRAAYTAVAKKRILAILRALGLAKRADTPMANGRV